MAANHKVAAAIDEERLGRLVDSLSKFGAVPEGGTDRQALTDADLAARRFFVDLARSYGAIASRDAAGNFVFRWSGTSANDPVVTGSHTDSQPTAGNLDGGFGVCAAIWTNEEGCRFPPGTMGSTAFVKPEMLEELRRSTDRNGVTFAEALRELDGHFPDVPRRELRVPFHAFVEAHIEQGPVLD
jgi:N-carbamoyl-L-amino-acid hydrolase